MRNLKDTRTRADKLRDLANHPSTTAGERANALAELERMGDAARASAAPRADAWDNFNPGTPPGPGAYRKDRSGASPFDSALWAEILRRYNSAPFAERSYASPFWRQAPRSWQAPPSRQSTYAEWEAKARQYEQSYEVPRADARTEQQRWDDFARRDREYAAADAAPKYPRGQCSVCGERLGAGWIDMMSATKCPKHHARTGL